MNDVNNFTESSENDFPPIQNMESINSFNESSISFSEPPNKRFQNFPIKSIFIPELFSDKDSIQKYLCGLCENVCDDPVRLKECKCKKIFCRNCIDFYINNKKMKCPLCNANLPLVFICPISEDKTFEELSKEDLSSYYKSEEDKDLGIYYTEISSYEAALQLNAYKCPIEN